MLGAMVSTLHSTVEPQLQPFIRALSYPTNLSCAAGSKLTIVVESASLLAQLSADRLVSGLQNAELIFGFFLFAPRVEVWGLMLAPES